MIYSNDRGSVIDSRENLPLVRCRYNSIIRIITKVNNSRTFEDDGKISGHTSPYCYFSDYLPENEEAIAIYRDVYKVKKAFINAIAKIY